MPQTMECVPKDWPADAEESVRYQVTIQEFAECDPPTTRYPWSSYDGPLNRSFYQESNDSQEVLLLRTNASTFLALFNMLNNLYRYELHKTTDFYTEWFWSLVTWTDTTSHICANSMQVVQRTGNKQRFFLKERKPVDLCNMEKWLLYHTYWILKYCCLCQRTMNSWLAWRSVN